MTILNLIDYYKAINGDSTLDSGVWNINYDKSHAFKIYSDVDVIDEYGDKIVLSPSPTQTDTINKFSDKLEQKFKNTKIILEDDETEKVELSLDDRIVTIIMDQSGSMTWNDNSNFRHSLVEDIVNKIENNYPGDITYNLVEYGGKYINVLLFGVIEENTDTEDKNTIDSVIGLDDNENFTGIRVIRNDERYPAAYNPQDGDLVNDGFIGKVLDTNLSTGQDYYYRVYTYDNNLRFSEGKTIKVIPRNRDIPRGISIFKSFVESNELTKGIPLIGNGVYGDDNTLGIWHMDEGSGTKSYDFSDTGAILTHSNETPIWYDKKFVPAGISGLLFNGESDYLYINDESDLWRDVNGSQPELTAMAWVFPYRDTGTQTVVISVLDNNVDYGLTFSNKQLIFNCRSTNGYRGTTIDDVLILNQWQHIAATYHYGTILLYHNGVLQPSTTLNTGLTSTGTNYHFSIGARLANSGPIYFFSGKITEVSIHRVARSSDYINEQIINSSILDDDGIEVAIEKTGIKSDNGDRLVVLEYEIPDDYNFSGGEVVIVKNEDHIPSWEEDGTIVHQTTAVVGQTFVSDSGSFLLGSSYYYRIFSKNSIGNYSFVSDSPYLEFDIPVSSSDEYFPNLIDKIEKPLVPVNTPLITAGNRKVYLRWRQSYSINSKVEKIKIFYSSINYPVVDKSGVSNGQLVFNGLKTDTKFVHRNLNNNIKAYYTLVNVDKYGRSSNYNSDGVQVEDFLHALTTPTADADESIIPLIDVEDLHYELVNDTSVSVIWNQPQKNPEDINAFFDQTVIIYSSITDQYSSPISEDSPIHMFINSNIVRETQADDVFSSTQVVSFEDKDAYDFFVDRTDEGLIKATLRITDNPDIIPQIKEATFEIQVKSFVPREGYISPTENTVSTDPLAEYSSLIETQIGEIEGTNVSSDNSGGDNVFEYLSKKITIKFTNPWEIEVVNRDNAKVSERCYFEEEDEITKEKFLSVTYEDFNGIYMKASSPFVARAKVKYKGEIVESGTIDLSVWDADSSKLCANARSTGEGATSFEGDKIQVSPTVLLPSDTLPIIVGEEDIIVDGETVSVPISYVDIPLYAPDSPQAVRLYVKGTNAGYNSTKDIYILFQNILQIDIQANSPKVDGAEVAEQQAQVYLINPDYPNFRNNDYDRSLITYPENNTVVQWESIPIDGNKREIYSIDNVPIPNGIYSYTRNGVARNTFMGPIEKGDTALNETHEINATIVYNGLSSQARQFIKIEYTPDIYEKFSARFLMEVDGGWIGTGSNSRWGGAGWLNAESKTMWADGSDYRKIKISRNPRVATSSEFSAATAFRECAEDENSEVLELSDGQIVNIKMGNYVEILYGNIIEEIDEYTGNHFLTVVKDEGFSAQGEADITLNNQVDSDITYFYIRVNKFVPNAGSIDIDTLIDDTPINECLDLKPSNGLFKKDLPRWEPTEYISGTTTLFVDERALTLRGGGDFKTGIPPCPLCLKEPLEVYTIIRQVIQDGEIFEVDNNTFTDKDGKSIIKYDSDIIIKVQVLWRRERVPDGTPVYVSIGDNGPNNLFIASQDTYYTETEDDGKSYATITIVASENPEQTTIERITIFSTYDEKGEVERNKGVNFSLTIDKENETAAPPSTVPTNPVEISSPVSTPYSNTIERYSILNNSWDTVKSMSENKGNSFSAAINNKIYVIGGLKNNEIDISEKNEKYDTVTNIWEDVRKMVTPRFGGSTVVIGKYIYTIGGIGIDLDSQGEVEVSRAIERYDTSNDEWQVLTPMPIINEGGAFEENTGIAFGTAQHITINNENYIYVLSGINSVIKTNNGIDILKYNKRILRYSIEEDSWSYSDKLFTDELLTYQRISPLSIFYDNKIIVFNGSIEDSNKEFIYPTDDFYINVTNDSLSRNSTDRYINFGSGFFSTFPVPKYQATIVKYDIDPSASTFDYYIIGGSNNDAESLDLVEKISTNTTPFPYENSYKTSDEDASNVFLNYSLPVAKHGASAVFSYGAEASELMPYVYVIGGFTIAREENYVDIKFSI